MLQAADLTIRLNAADDVVKIAPGGEHHLWVRYAVEAL